MNNNIFQQYKKELAEITESLDLKKAFGSERKGGKKFRDHFVFLKMALAESLSYFAIVQTVLLFTALTPQAVENINRILKVLHVPYQFPVGFSSIATILLFSIVFLFGIISYRYFGLARRANEVSALYSPGNLLLFAKLKKLEEEIEKLKK